MLTRYCLEIFRNTGATARRTGAGGIQIRHGMQKTAVACGHRGQRLTLVKIGSTEADQFVLHRHIGITGLQRAQHIGMPAVIHALVAQAG